MVRIKQKKGISVRSLLTTKLLIVITVAAACIVGGVLILRVAYNTEDRGLPELMPTEVSFVDLIENLPKYHNQLIKTTGTAGLHPPNLVLEPMPPSRAFLYAPGAAGLVYILPENRADMGAFYAQITPKVADNIDVVGTLKSELAGPYTVFWYIDIKQGWVV